MVERWLVDCQMGPIIVMKMMKLNDENKFLDGRSFSVQTLEQQQ